MKSIITIKQKYILSVTMLLLLLVSAADATDSNAYIGRLNNGMDVVLVENHSVPMIACNIVIKAGARDETWETSGAAHFLEHLLFNGTVNRSQDEIYAEFDRIGAYHNAHTGSHFIDFMLLVSRENFPAGFEILADMIFNSTLPGWKFEKERGIIMEEIAQSSSRGPDTELVFLQALYGESPLARPVLGTVESIERMERDSVLAFYRRWFVPNNMLLFATGSFAADTMFNWFENNLTDFEPHELPARHKLHKPDYNSLDGPGVVLRSSASDNRSIHAAFDAPQPGHSDFPAFEMVSAILESGLEDKLTSGASAGGHMILDPDMSIYRITLNSPSDAYSADDLVSVLDGAISDLIRDPPDKIEISRRAFRYRADRKFSAEMLSHYGIMYARYWALVSWDEFSSWPNRMNNINPQKLREVAQRWLVGSDSFIMAIEPVEMVEEADTVLTESSIERFETVNGPTLIIRSDPSAQVFAAHVLIKNRWLYDREFGTGAVDLLHQLLDEPTGGKGSDLKSKIDELAAKLKVADNPWIPFDNYYTTPDYSFIRLEILPDRWREGIDLIAGMMTDIPLTQEALKSAKEQTAAARSSQRRSAVGQGRKRLRDQLIPGVALASPVYGDVTDLTSSDIKRLAAQYFQPGNIIISAVGAVEADLIKAELKSAFTGLPRSDTPPVVQETTLPFSQDIADTALRDTITLGRAQGAVVMGKVIPEIDPADRAALTVANAYFNERLSAVLREMLGLAYSLGSSVGVHPAQEHGMFGFWEIYIATRQENIERAEEEIHVLITAMTEHEFSDDEVEKLRNAIAGRLLMRSMSRISQAYSMATGEFYWNDPGYREQLIESIKHITAEQVEAVVAKYLTSGEMSVVIVK
ncbi:insulinase family protein [bacterium]|nr:insulinase family protein [bacterium]